MVLYCIVSMLSCSYYFVKGVVSLCIMYVENVTMNRLQKMRSIDRSYQCRCSPAHVKSFGQTRGEERILG